MKKVLIKSLIVCCFLFVFNLKSNSKNANDSLKLAQAYINLSLTSEYFDSISTHRISKIIPYIENELTSIIDTGFNRKNESLINFTFSYLYLIKARLLFRNKTEINRSILLIWKATLAKSIQYFNDAKFPLYTSFWEYNPYYVLIGANLNSCNSLKFEIQKLQSEFNTLFSRNLYPDFQRIYYTAKERNIYDFDSLKYYSELFSIPIEFNISKNIAPNVETHSIDYSHFTISQDYKLELALDLISQYVQFSFIAKNEVPIINEKLLYESYDSFIVHLAPDSLDFHDVSSYVIHKDLFFRKEINAKACSELYISLQKKIPLSKGGNNFETYPLRLLSMKEDKPQIQKYYFPNPAPFPSSKFSINHFRPDLDDMGQVDTFFTKCFKDAGYEGRLHYYYINDYGFAITTGIEKINKNGSPINPDEERWNLKAGRVGNFSLYQIFKVIFFATESDFRIIACIVSPNEVAISTEQFGINEMSHLIDKSYSSLPTDLEDLSLDDKTMTILVYHFYQSDIGEVPIIDTSNKLTVQQHFRQTSSLVSLINQ